MSTNNTSINISKENVYGNCDLKCAYNFEYSQSNSTATNQGQLIILTYDKGKIPPVLYNSEKYNVEKIYIVSPSIHTFNGKTTSAEIIVGHTPILGGSTLYVCIPIIQSSDSTPASNLLTEIIQSVSSNAPAAGNSTNLNLSGFTLQNIVPKKPFYNYTSISGGLPGNFIVFGMENAIPLSQKILTILGNIIKPFPISIPNANLFFNSAGPNSSKTNDGIYISCQPTGSSEEEMDVSFSKNQPTYDFSAIINNPIVLIIFQVLIGCMIFILVFFGISYAYSYVTSDAIKIPKLSSPF